MGIMYCPTFISDCIRTPIWAIGIPRVCTPSHNPRGKTLTIHKSLLSRFYGGLIREMSSEGVVHANAELGEHVSAR